MKALILPLVIALSSAVSARAAQPPAAEWQKISGQHSGIAVFRAVVVQDAEAWQRLWEDHQGSLESLPEVDFSRERVVAVFLGLRHTGGHSVDFDVRATRDGIVVGYEVRRPKGFAASVMSAPFAIVKVPAAPIKMVAMGEAANAPRALENGPAPSRMNEAKKRLEGLQERLESLKFD